MSNKVKFISRRRKAELLNKLSQAKEGSEEAKQLREQLGAHAPVDHAKIEAERLAAEKAAKAAEEKRLAEEKARKESEAKAAAEKKRKAAEAKKKKEAAAKAKAKKKED
jgi:membrane protein involved in colicin uptake